MTSKQEPHGWRKTDWIGFCLSIPALAAWIWTLGELHKIEVPIAVIAPMTLGIGGVAYVVHRQIWKWRGAVVVLAFVLHFAALVLVTLLARDTEASEGSLAETLWPLIEFPLDSVRWSFANFDPAKPSMTMIPLLIFGSFFYAVGLHPLFPTFFTAISTSIGFSLYLQVSFLLLSHAG